MFSGLRPGEKLYEELLADADDTLASKHPRLRIARLQERAGDDWMQALLAWLDSVDGATEPAACRRALKRFVPEYDAR